MLKARFGDAPSRKHYTPMQRLQILWAGESAKTPPAHRARRGPVEHAQAARRYRRQEQQQGHHGRCPHARSQRALQKL